MSQITIEQAEVTTLGGGCFWCMEAIFGEIKGVIKVESGYSGGHLSNPTYEQVSTGNTGHAEVVQLTFNPNEISFKDILKIFFTVHDPTTLNRQGTDVGSQYRSVIFYHTAKQKAIAEEVVIEINAVQIWNAPIVTQIESFKTFYPAEEYHNNYFKRNSEQSYCKLVIAPKITKLRRNYRQKLKRADE